VDIGAYEQGKRVEYAALAKAIADILSAAVSAYPGLRLQQAQHRAKAPESLKRKLDGITNHDNDKIEEFVKDLAGCRLVFYTNSDVERFLNSGIISKNFNIDRTEIHYPTNDKKMLERSLSPATFSSDSRRNVSPYRSMPPSRTWDVKSRFRPS